MSILDKKIAKLDEKITRLKMEKIELEKKRAEQLDRLFLEPREEIINEIGQPKYDESFKISPPPKKEKKKKKDKKKDKSKTYEIVSSQETLRENYCRTCKKDFATYRRLECHNWKYHPSNEYERSWANTDQDTDTGTKYYMDDPY